MSQRKKCPIDEQIGEYVKAEVLVAEIEIKASVGVDLTPMEAALLHLSRENADFERRISRIEGFLAF